MLNFKGAHFFAVVFFIWMYIYFKKMATSQKLAGGHVTKDCQNGQNNYRIPKRLSKFYVHTKIFLIPPFVELWQNQKDKFCWSWYQLINVMMICIKRKNNIFNDLTMRKNWPKLEVSVFLLPAENKKRFLSFRVKNLIRNFAALIWLTSSMTPWHCSGDGGYDS